MLHRMTRGYRYSYRARIKKETLPAIQALAAALGFVNHTPGRFHGESSPSDLLDALAAAYRADPAAVADALMAAGVVKRADADD